MAGILEKLAEEVLIAPGAISTNLANLGYKQSEQGQWWVFNNPDAYKRLLRAWIDIGCGFLQADSANRFKLKKFGLEDKTSEINYKITRLTKEVLPANLYLGFGLDATTVLLPPMGEASVEEVYGIFLEMVKVAEDIGVDFYVVSGIELEQTELAIKAVRDNSRQPVFALLHSLDLTPRGFRTIMGVDPTTAAKKFHELGAEVIGFICGSVDYKETATVIAEMRCACNEYLFAKPNAGIPELKNGKIIYPRTPEDMAEAVTNWIKSGARIVSGCCGTTPEHLARVSAILKKAS
jgi:5-methyltetrahydrofolate--homocysteine methyltransferase